MSAGLMVLNLDDGSTCWRQIHPSLRDGEFAKLEAFIPSTKDNRQLSVGHSSKATAEQCFEAYRSMGLASVGVAQIRAAAIANAAAMEGVETSLVDDSALQDRPDWHCYVDFGQIAERPKRKAFAQQLWHAAQADGWAIQALNEADPAA